ncbi:MAG: hypothetical protein SFV15_19295 [Polyangiaceae bacterium]|nr:hypothetical protein [Polyangiaceae bacterium]
MKSVQQIGSAPNIYALVEGKRTEKELYRAWLRAALPKLEVVGRPEDLGGNSLFLVSGNGYPSYKQRIIQSLQDIAQHGAIDAFLVCVDSEEMSRDEKLEELQTILKSAQPFPRTKLVVHDCCIETWLLAHRKIVSRTPQESQLGKFVAHFDVTHLDPEKMPLLPEFRVRAQHHFAYLKASFRERGLSYTKAHPGCACDAKYFEELARRCTNTGHISSFRVLLDVLAELGAEPERIGRAVCSGYRTR